MKISLKILIIFSLFCFSQQINSAEVLQRKVPCFSLAAPFAACAGILKIIFHRMQNIAQANPGACSGISDQCRNILQSLPIENMQTGSDVIFYSSALILVVGCCIKLKNKFVIISKEKLDNLKSCMDLELGLHEHNS